MLLCRSREIDELELLEKRITYACLSISSIEDSSLTFFLRTTTAFDRCLLFQIKWNIELIHFQPTATVSTFSIGATRSEKKTKQSPPPPLTFRIVMVSMINYQQIEIRATSMYMISFETERFRMQRFAVVFSDLKIHCETIE